MNNKEKRIKKHFLAKKRAMGPKIQERVVNVNNHEYRCWENFDYSGYRSDHKQWVDEIEIEKKKTEQQNRLVKRSAVMGVTIQYKNNSPEEYYMRIMVVCMKILFPSDSSDP